MAKVPSASPPAVSGMSAERSSETVSVTTPFASGALNALRSANGLSVVPPLGETVTDAVLGDGERRRIVAGGGERFLYGLTAGGRSVGELPLPSGHLTVWIARAGG